MASSGQRKTTLAKLNRERRLLERRLEKQAKKVARKQAVPSAFMTRMSSVNPRQSQPDSSLIKA